MPRCEAAQAVSARPQWDIQDFARAYRSCPELVAWAQEHLNTSGYAFAVKEPGLYLRGLAEPAAEMLSGSGYGAAYAKPVRVLPELLQRAIFQPRAMVLPALLSGLLLCLAVGWWAKASRRRPVLIYVALALAVASAASLVFTLMHSAGEYSRLGLQESVLFRLSLVMLFVAALDSALSRDGTPGDELG